MQKLMQVKNYLLEASFTALLVYVLCTGVSVGAALVLVSLVGSMAYDKFLTREKIETSEAMLKDIEDLKNKVNTLSLEKGLRRTTNEQEASTTATKKPVTKYF